MPYLWQSLHVNAWSSWKDLFINWRLSWGKWFLFGVMIVPTIPSFMVLILFSLLSILFVTTWSPGTSDLTMRFGLHSGPVTAGVLRGAKSRFQLFGDTVNTGKGNPIHKHFYLLYRLETLWCIIDLTASLWEFLASFYQLHVWNRMDREIEFMYHNRPQNNLFLPARVVGWQNEKTKLVPKEKASCKRTGFLRNFLQVMAGRCQIVIAATLANHQHPPLALMRLMMP